MDELGRSPAADLEVRPPKQARSREAWQRALEAGVALLEEGGYGAFTIAALCERARVAPPFLYARAANKDALFLAVYEHGVSRLRREQEVFADAARWARQAPPRLVRAAVAEMLHIALRHQRFLRAVVLISSTHPEVRRRGSRYSQELGAAFTRVLLPAAAAMTHDDPEAAIRSCFTTVFAAAMIRIAYGPDFATPDAVDDEQFARDLGETATRYLLGEVAR
jgi:AcrR family transcriptional regulator